MKQLSTLYLFVHPIPRHEATRQEYMDKWEKLIIAEGSKDDQAICLLSNAPKEMEHLIHWAKGSFGARCIVDPQDESIEAKVLLAEDLDRIMSKRGNKGEWHPYGIWTSNNARR